MAVSDSDERCGLLLGVVAVFVYRDQQQSLDAGRALTTVNSKWPPTAAQFFKLYRAAGNVPIYGEQLARWKKEDPTDNQRAEIERLERQLEQYVVVIEDILKLAREHEQFTIEKVMERDDAEVGLDSLLGKMDRWR